MKKLLIICSILVALVVIFWPPKTGLANKNPTQKKLNIGSSSVDSLMLIVGRKMATVSANNELIEDQTTVIKTQTTAISTLSVADSVVVLPIDTTVVHDLLPGEKKRWFKRVRERIFQ